tara:strand:- start:22 stop:498 length:477 start_codon:yes stop_codon:yes gene_type:complete
MAKKGKVNKDRSFKKYGRKEDESVEKFLDRIMGNTKKERDMELRNTYRRLGILEDMDKAQQLDDEARRRRTQLGNKRTKKQLSREEEIRRGIPNRRMMRRQFEEEGNEQKSIRPRKYRPNQMDRDDPSGIDVKKGGLILRVTNRGPLYKGKKSGNKNS